MVVWIPYPFFVFKLVTHFNFHVSDGAKPFLLLAQNQTTKPPFSPLLLQVKRV